MFSILYVKNLSQQKIQANAFRLMLPKAMRESRAMAKIKIEGKSERKGEME